MTDLGHYGPAIPIIAYGVYYIWNALEKKEQDDKTPSRNPRRSYLKLWFEIFFLFVFGAILFGMHIYPILRCPNWHKTEINRCYHENTMHVFTGAIFMVSAVILTFWLHSTFLRRYLHNESVYAYLFVVIGLMLLGHQSGNEYGHGMDMSDEETKVKWEILASLHQAAGIASILGGLTMPFAARYPQHFAILAGYFVISVGVFFCCSMPAMIDTYWEMKVSSFNVVFVDCFVVLCIVTGTMLLKTLYYRLKLDEMVESILPESLQERSKGQDVEDGNSNLLPEELGIEMQFLES